MGVTAMALITIPSVRKLLLIHSRGLSTRIETELGLIAAAADIAPALIAAELSDEWLAVLRNLSATPPASPSEIRIINSMAFGPELIDDVLMKPGRGRIDNID